MKLSIEAELVYNFANDTQIIASLEASRTSDQVILSDSLDILASVQVLSDTTLWRSADMRIALGRGHHQVPSGCREQPSAIASSVRMSAGVV